MLKQLAEMSAVGRYRIFLKIKTKTQAEQNQAIKLKQCFILFSFEKIQDKPFSSFLIVLEVHLLPLKGAQSYFQNLVFCFI